MSTKVIKFKVPSKDTKVMTKDQAWHHYAAEMTKTINELRATIASKDKEIETLNEGIVNTAMYMSEELSKRPKIDDYLSWRAFGIRHFNLCHGFDADDSSSDSSSDSESEWEDDEDTEAPPPYEQ